MLVRKNIYSLACVLALFATAFVNATEAKAMNGLWCEIDWLVGGDRQATYYGWGPTEPAAFESAKNRCKSINNTTPHYCYKKPVSMKCEMGAACIEEKSLASLDFPGWGNKKKWCQNAGFDDKHPDREACIRTCPSPCETMSITVMGYQRGDKTRYCNVRGYRYYHEVPYGEWKGYCYNYYEDKDTDPKSGRKQCEK